MTEKILSRVHQYEETFDESITQISATKIRKEMGLE